MEKTIIDKLNLTDSGKTTGASFVNNEVIWYSQSLDVYVMECDMSGFKHPEGLITVLRDPNKGIAPILVSPEFLKDAAFNIIQAMVKEYLFS